MKHFFTLILIAFALSAQSQNTAVFSKVTATWCPNCGTWGWDFMEEMKGMYNGGDDALILGVHHSGNLRNEVSSWWSDNLKPVGQPQFFVNNTNTKAGSSNWSSKLTEIGTMINDFGASGNAPTSFVNAYINSNGEIETNIINQPIETSTNDQYFNIYLFENNVEDIQSGQSGTVMHPNVLRASIFDSNEGQLIPAGSISVTAPIELNYTYALDPNWNPDNVGLLAIMWEDVDGTFQLKSATAVKNIGRLSNVESSLDGDLFSIKTETSAISIAANNNSNYNYSLADMSGKTVVNGEFSQNVSFSTEQFPNGIYILNIQEGDKYFTQKVFIR